MYTFSIKSCYSYLNIFSILPPIITLYRLTIATHYGHLYIKYIEITYNISYNGSLYFAIPDVGAAPASRREHIVRDDKIELTEDRGGYNLLAYGLAILLHIYNSLINMRYLHVLPHI